MSTKLRVHRIQTGTVQLHTQHLEGKGNLLYWMFFGKTWTEPLPINTYLIEHPKGLVLFDTGENSAVNEPDYFPKWAPSYKKTAIMNINESDTVVRGIQKLGYTPDDVRYVVLSHLHTDHVGGVHQFPKATFIINEREWNDAHQFGSALFRGYLKDKFDFPGRNYMIIRHRPTELANPFTFGYDLFNDGKLILIPTPGHTRGHQSMLVYEEKPLCLAGDAIFSQKHLQFSIPDGVSSSKTVARITIPLLRHWSALNQNAPILCAHDPEAKNLLKTETENEE